MDDFATVTTHPASAPSAGPIGHAEDVDDGELLRVGTVVGRYVVAEHVGAGGMGRVYAAYDPELDRKVALKLLRSERDDDDGCRRLLGEARALAKLAHPNVVTVHDVGIVDARVFVAMEYVSGTTLRQALVCRRHGWRRVLDVLVPVARGLAAVHAAGLVHRDLKPDNVMLGDDGRVRVMDFGLARAPPTIERETLSTGRVAEADAVALTRTGIRVGTPAYMAPEQWRGQPADARSDQFAYCVMLWETLYGARPFVGGTLAELERVVTRGERSLPARGKSAVPRWLRGVLERGLSVEPRERFASMDALVETIDRGRRRARLQWVAAGAVPLGIAVLVLVLDEAGAPALDEPSLTPPPSVLRGGELRVELDAAPDPTTLAPCDEGQVCVRVDGPIPVCLGGDGKVSTSGSSCAPGGGGGECPAQEACVVQRYREGELGRCVPGCAIIDDRPECVPGCYNQLCGGAFEMCLRAHGECAEVPCTSDADCEALAACDYPERRGPRFRCSPDVGKCWRVQQ